MAGLNPPAIDASDEWLTQQQVAAALKVTVPTVRSKIDRGELPAYRFGPRVVRVRRSDVEKLLTPIPVHPKLQAAIQKSLDEAPPLTDEQRTRIAALLRTGSGA
jgi:excisionase family DNA binding protein